MQTQGKVKSTINTYTLLSTDSNARTTIVVKDVPWSKIKETLIKSHDANKTYRATQTWVDEKGEKRIKCWGVKINDKAAFEYETYYSFKVSDITVAAFAEIDVKVLEGKKVA